MNITKEGEEQKVKIMKFPCTKDTIGCATEVKQPSVPDIKKNFFPGPTKL